MSWFLGSWHPGPWQSVGFGAGLLSTRRMVNFISRDRTQAILLPPDLRDWIGDDELVHFITAAVERVDIGAFKENWRGHGKVQYHPRMMLGLLIYCYENGNFFVAADRAFGRVAAFMTAWRARAAHRPGSRRSG